MLNLESQQGRNHHHQEPPKWEPEPPEEPRGEPIAYIRAWGGQIVGTIYEDPPPVPKNSDPFNLLEDLQRQRNWKP